MTASVRQRLESIDLLRGVIIVVMALDHIRDYVHYGVEPTDLATTTAPLFATRWITHFCAPVFMLLAGTGAYLGLANGKTKRELSWFLITRGVWLVFLEVTVVRCFGWFFNFDYSLVVLVVLWALGAAMIVLAALIWLPRAAVLAICIVGIVGHNALDHFRPDSWLWRILHAPGELHLGGASVVVGYVLVPWVFVMGLGYAIGPLMRWTPERRRKVLVGAGLAMVAAFIVLRTIDRYGDPHPWTSQPSSVFTVLSFLDCTKYPPSLCYLLMTLGPAFVALALFEHWRGRIANFFLVYGRVPLFFYLLHLPLLHLVAVGLALTRYGHAGFLFENRGPDDVTFFPAPPDYGYPLWVVYLVWIGVVAALYVPCRWFGEYKRTHRAAWLSYL